MKVDQKLFQTLKQYHNKSLTIEEVTAFESRLAEDQVFAEEVKTHETMYQTIQQYGDQQLDSELMKMGQQLLAQGADQQKGHQKSGKIRSFQPWYLAAVAAAVTLLLIVLIPEMIRQPATPGDLYKTHFEPFEPRIVRGFATPQIVWTEAVEAYKQENYSHAIEKFQTLIDDSTFIRKSEVWLFVGISYLAQDKPEEAMDALVQVSDTSGHIDMANWYIAMTHLRLDQPGQARILLEEIATDQRHERRAKARKILNELEE
ncbi:MAG: hypothetical protein AAF587_20790 [Bacteroidota bacterium]